MSGYVDKSETAKKMQMYATSIFQVHSFVCQLDYTVVYSNTTWKSVIYNKSNLTILVIVMHQAEKDISD